MDDFLEQPGTDMTIEDLITCSRCHKVLAQTSTFCHECEEIMNRVDGYLHGRLEKKALENDISREGLEFMYRAYKHMATNKKYGDMSRLHADSKDADVAMMALHIRRLRCELSDAADLILEAMEFDDRKYTRPCLDDDTGLALRRLAKHSIS